ncbi:AIPR family protein [Desulfitobacterium sp. THU1]|uniref:AIPR family protein n=1 Tax=Desulfitobacterium sp. THU1 TaxID=3138072 RepID=UPI00312004DD
MNQIIRSYLNAHIKEYGVEKYGPADAFEHFINKCIINRVTSERFDPQDVMTEKGEIGLDGVAIIVNNQLITDMDVCHAIFDQKRKVTIKFVFIQAKTSESFDGGDMSIFLKGVKHFFEPEDVRPATNAKMENLIKIKNYIYEKAIEQSSKPFLEMYYVCCGKWNEGNNLSNNYKTDVRFFEESGDFSTVEFFPYDSEKIITTYNEMRRKISRTFTMEKRLPFYSMPGVSVAYFGLIRCKDLARLLMDDHGELFNNIFEDNVRDFQGYNPVNSEIRTTLLDEKDQERFSVLNNGITIIAKNIETAGDIISIFDYQIVNGCQTSRVIFDNKEMLTDNSWVLSKVIQVENEDVLDRIVYTSNRQTEVKYEAFSSANRFHKTLQEYYASIQPEYRLYYERRSKQYDMDATINKYRIVSLAGQTFAYIAMFLNEPHSVNRYYGELLEAYKKRLYGKDDCVEPYYISAYYLYFIELAIKQNQIDKKFKSFKYHICCAMRALTCSSKLHRGNSKEIKKEAQDLIALIQDPMRFQRELHTACTCVENTINASGDIPADIRFRSRDFTFRLLKEVEKFTSTRNSDEHLCVGQIVSCQVTALRLYNIEVELRTDDGRKRGSIHISNIANRYIQNISDEAQLGEILQAKIITEFNAQTYGWGLSLILD